LPISRLFITVCVWDSTEIWKSVPVPDTYQYSESIVSSSSTKTMPKNTAKVVLIWVKIDLLGWEKEILEKNSQKKSKNYESLYKITKTIILVHEIFRDIYFE
jgi:hypothetical protein